MTKCASLQEKFRISHLRLK